MREFLEPIRRDPEESFHIGIFQDHIEQSRWHYHQDFELSFITEGSGKRIVGDSVEEFHPGDLIFIGPRIPHVWFPDESRPSPHSGRKLESVYLQFDQDVLPGELRRLPEFRNVNRALELSERGIRITGATLNEVSRLMLQLPYLPRIKRLMIFYEMMDLIGSGDSLTLLASPEYIRSKFETGNSRVKRIHEYMMANYQEDIQLEEIAEIVHLAPSSVCRFFKTATGQTLFGYLNRIKIDYACRLLANTDRNIVDISYDCGFRNLSHFNKQFRKIIGTTPSQFRNARGSS